MQDESRVISYNARKSSKKKKEEKKTHNDGGMSKGPSNELKKLQVSKTGIIWETNSTK